MKEIAAKDDGVLGRVYRVDPTGRNEKRVSGLDLDPATILHLVAEKDLALKYNNYLNTGHLKTGKIWKLDYLLITDYGLDISNRQVIRWLFL